MAKDIDEKVDQLEAAVDPNTVISIGGYSFTPAKLMIAGAIVSSTLGALYGAFEVYKDYMSMKEAIQTYVTPDLSGLDKKISIAEENAAKAVEYTRDIRNDLKNDIRRLETVVDSVERSAKQSQREADQAVKEARTELRELQRDTDQRIKQTQRESEQRLSQIQREVDDKIKKALDNPLSNK
jgi:DNA anti-recombination protein RmuC